MCNTNAVRRIEKGKVGQFFLNRTDGGERQTVEYII